MSTLPDITAVLGATGFVPETNPIIDISVNETIAIGIDASAQLPIQHDYLGNLEPLEAPAFTQPINVVVALINPDGSNGPALPNAAYVDGAVIVQLVPGSLLNPGTGYTLRAQWQNSDATSTYLAEVQLRVAGVAYSPFTWQPSIEEVSMMVPNLAQDASGIFNQTTYPTATTVWTLIVDVCSEVAAFAGDPDALSAQATSPERLAALDTLKAAAKRVATHGVAAQIEMAYTPASHRENRWGRIEHLRATYSDGLTRLRKSIAEFSRGQRMGGVNDANVVSVSAPEKQGWLVPPGFILNKETNVFEVDPNWGIW
jgi:hypothetical protein